jgi:WD40 repeat protein
MHFSFSHYSKILILLAIMVTLPQRVVMSQPNQPKQRDVTKTPLAWSSEGNLVAVPISNSVEVRDASNGVLRFTLNGHTGYVSSVSWSLDNATIATASHDQTVRLWRASDGSLLRTLSGHNDYVTFVGWTPDSKYVVSSGVDVRPTFLIWNVETGNPIGHHNPGTVLDGSFSPDGQKWANVNGPFLRVSDSTTFEQIARYRESLCCSNTMWSVRWSPDSTKLVTGSSNGLVTIWDAKTATVEQQFMINAYANHDALKVSDPVLAWVRDVRFSDDGTTVSAIAGDGTLKEWNVQTGQVVQATKLAPLATAAWSPFGARLAVLDASFLPAVDGTPSQKKTAETGFQVIVPNPTLARLNALAAVCVKHGDASQPAVRALTAKAVTQASLAAFAAQVKALPPGAIPAACQADLSAVAEALQNQ